MSLENETQSSPNEDAESFCESKKHSKISYTRDFLLSLSELDVCKNLPSGFDRSILSEFEDAFHGIQDRQRIPGSLPLQSYKRNEYGSSPPTKGESSNYYRAMPGRWDNRSSGRNERDSDSQSDWDSDSGRRYLNQSRRPWQSTEHDGLLGSGSFPRPSGYAAGLSAPKVRSNDHYQLNRSNEPYHPPRPYKALPHSRRETNDSYNDETFGSTEDTSQDRAEEERRRRESFELMRKEQQKAIQEKQKSYQDKPKDNNVSDIAELLGDAKDGKRIFNRSNELDESVTQPVSNNDTSHSSSQTHGSRPLVPPGFKGTVSERNSSTRTSILSHSEEVKRPQIEENLSHPKDFIQNGALGNQERLLAQKMGSGEQQQENMSIQKPSVDKSEQIVDSSAGLEVSNMIFGLDNQLYRTSSLSEASETQDGSGVIESNTKKVTGLKVMGNSKQDTSTSILDKLFGDAFTVHLGESSSFVEHRNVERDGTWSPSTAQSSKFVRWFHEDENKVAVDPLYARKGDLFSLIVSGEKGGTQVSDVKATKHTPPDLPYQSSELNNRHLTSNMEYSAIGMSEELHNRGKQEAVPAILTCEDLEQTILSEYSEGNSSLQASVEGWSVSGEKTQELKADVDDRATQHLLSILQKGTGLKDIGESLNLDTGSSDKLHVSERAIIGSALANYREEKAENIHPSGKTLTLETLFGSAFMQELQSAEAPVSVQRGSSASAGIDNSEPNGLSFGVMGEGLFGTSTVGIGSAGNIHEGIVLQSNQRQQSKSDVIENWFGINDTQVKVEPSKHQNEVVSKPGRFDGAVGIQLPEEESLIAVGGPVNTPNSVFMSAGISTQGELSMSNKPVDIVEKLSALNTILKDERPMVSQQGSPVVRGPYDSMEPEIPFHNLHAQPSSPQFRPPQMNQGRLFFHPLDSHPTQASSQMNFMAPDGMIRPDASATHQFPANMLHAPFHQPNTGPTRFDRPPPHPILQQMQMQMPANFPPRHLLREFPRGGPLPSNPSNHANGLMQELNPMQGLPFGQQQFGGLGMPLQASEVSGGGNHSEAFQRLLEMEVRANSKQIHPFATVGPSQGLYGHELDMGFRYR